MKLGIVLAGALLAIAGLGCSLGDGGAEQGPTQSASPYLTPHPRGFDPVMRDIAVEVPGFAGLLDDANTNTLHVSVTGKVTDIDKLRSAIVARFPDLSGRKIEIIDVAHEWRPNEWWDEIDSLWALPGIGENIVSTDVVEDRLQVGVLNEEAVAPTYDAIAGLGIPLQAVNVVVTGPIVPD